LKFFKQLSAKMQLQLKCEKCEDERRSNFIRNNNIVLRTSSFNDKSKQINFKNLN